MTVLIPAYEPDSRLLKLIDKITEACSYRIIIVDDGSGNAYRGIFRSAQEKGCTVLTHETNQGKGRTLKTGFQYIKELGEDGGVVCADSDGQHLPKDIIKISRKIKKYSQHVVLGCRRFIGKVPVRSLFGNTMTRLIFALSTGKKVYDTQTGLRGYSSDMLDWLCRIPGERFEYEMNMLLEAPAKGYDFHEVDIDTVYYSNNKSSHFRTFADSVRVYLPILKFSASSMLAGLLDFTLLLVFQFLTSNLLVSTIGARICSSIMNFLTNKIFVFPKSGGSGTKKSIWKYYTLAAVVLGLNYLLLSAFNEKAGSAKTEYRSF